MKSNYFKYPVLFTLIIFYSSFTALAQSRQQQKTDSVFVLVKKFFNAKQADSIYYLTGENFRHAISPGQFSAIAQQQLFTLNDIKGSSLISFVNNKVSTYKLVFEGTTLQLQMSLDLNNKLDLFLVEPFREITAEKIAPAATSNQLLDSIDKKVDSVARPYIQKANTVGLSIGILKNGKISTYNYGETEQNNKQLPDANTIYEIGSITKTFTATLLAWYANAGLVNLNDPIIKYLPDSVKANQELSGITLLMLGNHTSGLARLPDNLSTDSVNALNPYKTYSREQLFDYLETCRLNSIPGQQYAYSNLAFGLLGAILEQVSGKTFEQMVEDIIVYPLRIRSTVQNLSVQQQGRFAEVYNELGSQTPAWEFDVLAPCGALHSTVNDLLLYAKANMDNGMDKLSQAFILTRQVTFNKDTKLGIGWHIIAVDGVEYFFHNGGTYGSSSFLAFNADKNLAVVVLSNSAESVDALGTSIIKKLQQKPARRGGNYGKVSL